MTKKSKHEAAMVAEILEEDGKEVPALFITFDGVKIARRGNPDTPQAKQWISIEPGYTVREEGHNGLVIEFEGTRLH